MPRIIEDRHPGESWLLWKLGNLTAITDEAVVSEGVMWLFKENGKWVFIPRLTGNRSLFYNAVFFFRYTVSPFTLITFYLAVALGWYWALIYGVFVSFRWSGSTTKKALFQTGFGHKLNGRLGLPLRFQSDKSSAAGVTGPNSGQAQGFNGGTH